MQNKRHEAQSLPRLYAGYYETLTYPTLGQCTPYQILFYSCAKGMSRRIVQTTGKNRKIFGKKQKHKTTENGTGIPLIDKNATAC